MIDISGTGGLKERTLRISRPSPGYRFPLDFWNSIPHPKTQLLISDLRYVVDRLAEFYSPDETRPLALFKHGF